MFYNETFQSPFSKGYDLTQLISYYYIHVFPGWCVSWIPQPIIPSLFLYYMHWGINYERVKKTIKIDFQNVILNHLEKKNEKTYMINLLHDQTSDPSLHRQNRALFRFVLFVWIWLDSHGLSKAIVFVFFFFFLKHCHSLCHN